MAGKRTGGGAAGGVPADRFADRAHLDVDPDFGMPDLTDRLPRGGRVLPRPAVTLRCTYYDTPDLRLARAGLWLRHRRGGDAPPWTVRLAPGGCGPEQVTRSGAAGAIPDGLVALLTAYTRGAALVPMATLRTTRVRYEVRDRNDAMLAEITDDTVAVLDGRAVRTTFRELDMARRNGGPKLIRRIAGVLRDAGAVWAPPLDRHARVLGPVGAPDLRPPAPLPARPRAADVVTEALRRDIARLLTNDPLVRLRMDADDDTSVHRMRVGVRRLRSDLRTFAPLLDHAWSRPLREELRWLGGVLGAARDAEVLRARLRRTAAADLLAPLDEIAVARIDADLAARHEDARAALDDALASSRYRALVETLYAVAACPAVTPAARRRAGAVLPPIVACDLRRMACGRPSGAAPDADWHALRRRAKRTRYAVETLAPVAGPAAVGLATALADLTDLLGTHTDACLAGRLWLDIAAADPDDHVLAVTAGRLYERERATVRETRRAYPGVWRQLRRGTVSGWLR